MSTVVARCCMHNVGSESQLPAWHLGRKTDDKRRRYRRPGGAPVDVARERPVGPHPALPEEAALLCAGLDELQKAAGPCFRPLGADNPVRDDLAVAGSD